MVEWQTRQICMYVAATVPVAEGRENKLLAQAGEIGMARGENQAPYPGQAGDSPMEQRKPEPPAGSFERFMGMFGSGIRAQ